MPAQTVIVTGASGYLGSKLMAAYPKAEGKNLIGLDFRNSDYNLDLLDSEKLVELRKNLGQIELVHLAGQLPGTDTSTNLAKNSSAIIANLVQCLTPTRTLFLSSTAVYPTISKDNFLLPAPWESYGHSKFAVENFLRENSESYTIYRSGTMFDKNRKGGIQKLLTNGLSGKPVLIPNRGNVHHPFVSTSDVVSSIIFWIDNPGFLENKLSDLVSSAPVTLKTLISENSEVKSKVLNLPNLVRKIGSDNYPVMGISKWHINALFYDIAHKLKVSDTLKMKSMLDLFQ